MPKTPVHRASLNAKNRKNGSNNFGSKLVETKTVGSKTVTFSCRHPPSLVVNEFVKIMFFENMLSALGSLGKEFVR